MAVPGPANWKLWGSSIIASLLGIGLLIVALLIGESASQRYLNLALLILGATTGWLVGTVVSPYTQEEEAKFSAYTKAITVFASGYAVAKIDKAIEVVFAPDFLFQPLVGFRVIAFTSSCILSMLVTFIFRKYAH